MSEHERQYEDGRDPRVLDIIDIPVRGPRPEAHQTENWLLHPHYYWEKAGVYPTFGLPTLADPVRPLWIDGYSTHHGSNDQIPIEAMRKVSSSLRLLHVEDVAVNVFAPGEAFGDSKRRVQGRFLHAGQNYAFWITDPVYERRYLAKPDGAYRIGECYLTINLGEPYQGNIYKLIAAIIEGDGQ